MCRPFVLIWFSGGAFGRGLLLVPFVNSVPFGHSPRLPQWLELERKRKKLCKKVIVLIV
jgi:hypothetical protein